MLLKLLGGLLRPSWGEAWSVGGLAEKPHGRQCEGEDGWSIPPDRRRLSLRSLFLSYSSAPGRPKHGRVAPILISGERHSVVGPLLRDEIYWRSILRAKKECVSRQPQQARWRINADILKSENPEIRESQNPIIQKSGNPIIQKSENPELRTSENPERRISRNPNIRKGEHPEARKSGNQKIRRAFGPKAR